MPLSLSSPCLLLIFVTGDFTVSSFNDYDNMICILIEGVAQYLLHLFTDGGGPSLDDRSAYHAAVANIDLEWLVHFLDDYGFLYWDLRQSVRANDSHRIDLVWRECVSFMHTEGAHKTQYAPMALLRVFWSEALTPALARVYHRNRTLSLLGLPGSNVGLDMLIEKENLTIRNNVIRASIERITRFVRRLNFTAHVSRHLERVLFPHRNRMTYKKVDISRDVALVKQHLIATLGGTWAAANTPRTTLLLNPARAPAPWKAVERFWDKDRVVLASVPG